MFWHILQIAWHQTQRQWKQGLENVLQVRTNTSGIGSFPPSLKCVHSSSSLLKPRLLFIEIKLILKMTEWKRKRGLSLQHNINMRSQLVTEVLDVGGWAVCGSQLSSSR